MNEITLTIESDASIWGSDVTETQAERYAEWHARKMREWVATQYPDADIRIAVARGQATEWDRDGLEDGLEPDEIAILDAIRARAETTWMVDATECDDDCQAHND